MSRYTTWLDWVIEKSSNPWNVAVFFGIVASLLFGAADVFSVSREDSDRKTRRTRTSEPARFDPAVGEVWEIVDESVPVFSRSGVGADLHEIEEAFLFNAEPGMRMQICERRLTGWFSVYYLVRFVRQVGGSRQAYLQGWINYETVKAVRVSRP